jgi:hypothetical protein
MVGSWLQRRHTFTLYKFSAFNGTTALHRLLRGAMRDATAPVWLSFTLPPCCPGLRAVGGTSGQPTRRPAAHRRYRSRSRPRVAAVKWR